MVTIRSTLPEDFRPIADLTNSFIVGTPVHFGYDPITSDDVAEMHRKSQPRYPWLSAVVDGRFAGYAKAGVWRDRTAYSWTCETGIYMEPWCRGKGVGKTLYTALLDNLRSRGFHSAVGGLTLPNDASIKLHETCGFEYVGSFKHAGHKLGAWHDVAFFQVMLRDRTHNPAGHA